jgi:hypothetical protein
MTSCQMLNNPMKTGTFFSIIKMGMLAEAYHLNVIPLINNHLYIEHRHFSRCVYDCFTTFVQYSCYEIGETG